MAFTTIFVGDGQKNVSVLIKGHLGEDILEPQSVIDLDKMSPPPANIRIDGLWWLIEEKLGIRLWWAPGQILAPMESRNSIRFDSPLVGPRRDQQWGRKILMTTHDAKSPGASPVKYFTIGLDIEKLDR